MAITREEVNHVAELARLNLKEDQAEKLTGQMNDILAAIEKLRKLNTDDVDPVTHVNDFTGAFRDDVVKQSLEREKGLKNAPQSNGESFIVPKII